jgi:tricorn protease
MKKARVMLIVFVLMAGVSLAVEEGRFFRFPSISQNKIVFTYEGDLWLVSAQGGTATRITTFPGIEAMAKLSPDGNWIAFSAGYEGGQSVYLMPAEGGVPTRLTFQPGPAQVISWTPDGSRLVFRSMFENVIGRDPNLYYVSVKGGAPERLPLERGVLISFAPDGRSFLLPPR